jgi:DNA repair photolyase
MTTDLPAHERGRGAQIRPHNRFERVHVEPDFEHLAPADPDDEPERSLRTQFIQDQSRSVVSENDSPDVGFRYSLNPYRGCEHGCAYCYARPTHEYLGLDAGLDFESKIFVKEQAPALFREWLSARKHETETVVLSGVTDCYQPAERKYRITRGCLEVALAARQPVGIITKNALVTRDLDLLSAMSELKIVGVSVSITTLNTELARSMEPRTSPPASRLEAIAKLTQAGVRTVVMIGPVIPGLNDSEIPDILRAAREAGALSAAHVLLRLPWAVRPIFLDWLHRAQSTSAPRVESRIRSTRDGKLNDPNFGSRHRGSGEVAEQVHRTFQIFARKYGLDKRLPPLDTTQFVPPPPASGQLRLF